MTLLQSRQHSTSPVTLGYQYIYILFHTDRFPLLKTITGSHFSLGQLFIGMPGLSQPFLGMGPGPLELGKIA